MLIDVILSVIIMLSDIQSVIVLSVIMLSINFLSVIMLNVIMLSVVVPFNTGLNYFSDFASTWQSTTVAKCQNIITIVI